MLRENNLALIKAALEHLKSNISEAENRLAEVKLKGTQAETERDIYVLITTYGGQISELWEVAQASYYAKYPSTAEGVSLDNAVQYGGIRRSRQKIVVADTRIEVVYSGHS